ncbi:MAG TPA: TetR/AcrR family transcriptional regulator [Microbacterium sp.]|nr:TetR/AcrR family transcriptional regulator [Microbacterium sp.]
MMNTADDRPRPYRSELRERQAAETRRRVIQAAVELFSRQGFPGTTVAQIAKHAGVSVETVQKHGPKSELLRHAVELAAFGVEGETDVRATDAGRAMLGARSSGEFATVLGRMVVGINAPAAGVWMTVVGVAHGDAESREFQTQMLASIRLQVEQVLRVVDERGWLRGDVPFDDLVEAVCILTSVETYVRFVQLDGKPVEAYEAFVARAIKDTVLAR